MTTYGTLSLRADGVFGVRIGKHRQFSLSPESLYDFLTTTLANQATRGPTLVTRDLRIKFDTRGYLLVGQVLPPKVESIWVELDNPTTPFWRRAWASVVEDVTTDDRQRSLVKVRVEVPMRIWYADISALKPQQGFALPSAQVFARRSRRLDAPSFWLTLGNVHRSAGTVCWGATGEQISFARTIEQIDTAYLASRFSMDLNPSHRMWPYHNAPPNLTEINGQMVVGRQTFIGPREAVEAFPSV